MQYEIRIHSVILRHLAVVRKRIKFSELGRDLILLLDRVYKQVHSGKIIQTGQNVFVYKEGTKEDVLAEVGVEVAGPFEAVEDVVYSSTPAGEAASTVHIGPCSDLGNAYAALTRWCQEHNRTELNVHWEVYGDWEADPAKLQTEVFFLLQS